MLDAVGEMVSFFVCLTLSALRSVHPLCEADYGRVMHSFSIVLPPVLYSTLMLDARVCYGRRHGGSTPLDSYLRLRRLLSFDRDGYGSAK